MNTSDVILSAATDSDVPMVDDLEVNDPGAAEHNMKGTLRFDRPTPQHLARPRFGEPLPDLEAKFASKMRGVYAKVGSAPAGIIATSSTIIMVDCQSFTGATRFPESLTKDWKQGGDSAVLLEPWLNDSQIIQVRRQRLIDAKWEFSGEVECFSVKSACMLEHHVLSASWVNMLSGYFHTNPQFRDPEICMWLSNRRGVPYDEAQSDYIEFISGMSGPIGVFDVIKSDLSNFSSKMSNDQFTKIKAQNCTEFEGLVVALKPDFSMRNGVVVFVTLWRQVLDCRDRSPAEYREALKANCVHRTLYDFEKFMFEIKGSLCDLQSAEDMVKASQILLDYVSDLLYLISVLFSIHTHKKPRNQYTAYTHTHIIVRARM